LLGRRRIFAIEEGSLVLWFAMVFGGLNKSRGVQ
jgi:hypothetical protein